MNHFEQLVSEWSKSGTGSHFGTKETDFCLTTHSSGRAKSRAPLTSNDKLTASSAPGQLIGGGCFAVMFKN
jgi:hypothetical protein